MFARQNAMSFRGTVKTVPYAHALKVQGRAGACSRRLCPLREGAVKCAAFDWGRDFSVSLPPSFACGKSHPLTAAVSLCRFATSPSHCEGVDPPRGRNNGSSSYGCAITPLSLRDISPNRGISPTPTNGAPSRRPLRSNCIFSIGTVKNVPYPENFIPLNISTPPNLPFCAVRRGTARCTMRYQYRYIPYIFCRRFL